MKISIIIPTYNEAARIGQLVTFLRSNMAADGEIIVSDGGSTDTTITIAETAGARAVLCPAKGRSFQMNFGASLASGDLLYFIHADTLPPSTFLNDVSAAIKRGYEFGRYRTRFDSRSFILRVNAFFTRFDLFVCYGGDQTLYITRALFNRLGGYNKEMKIMEDYDIVVRARKLGRYGILQKDVLVSARKYETNSWLAVQKANYKVVQMYKKGASQLEMVTEYRKMLDYR